MYPLMNTTTKQQQQQTANNKQTTTMPTLPLSNLPAAKGVRRPFGKINVNRPGPRNNSNNNEGKSGKAGSVTKAVVKPAGGSTSKQDQRELPNTTQSSTTVEATRVDSIFRQPPSEESSKENHGLLSLQLANPVHDENDEPTSDHNSNDDDTTESIYLPFTRADGCCIVEPLETSNVRSMFRRPLIDFNDEWNDMMTLKRANPIMDDNDDDDATNENVAHHSHSVNILYFEQGHVTEQMSIMDLMM